MLVRKWRKFGKVYLLKKNKYELKFCFDKIRFFSVKSYSKKSQDQRATYAEAKNKLSSNDLQIIDADEKAKRIEHRIKKV